MAARSGSNFSERRLIRTLLFCGAVAVSVGLSAQAAVAQNAVKPPPATPGAQSTPAATQSSAVPTATPAQTATELLALSVPKDINTASFYQLAAWLKQLGLSTQGTRTELMARLYDHYGLKPPVEEPPQNAQQIITIEAANQSNYFRIEQPNQRYLRLSGGVSLRLVDKKTGDVHQIKADEIVFNQTEDLLTARGNIVYTVTNSGKKEVFTGDGLTFRLNDWDGFFIDGTSHRTQQVNNKPIDFAFSGKYISRSKENIVVMDGGSITSSTANPPYYTIRARKIWVLAQGEWGLQDAVIYVGHVPVLYFPFFFKPGDQAIFHPAVGYQSRNGSFLQTTVYIVGQKKDTSSPLSFLQIGADTTNAPREAHGLFLRLKPETPQGTTAPAPAPATTSGGTAQAAASPPATGSTPAAKTATTPAAPRAAAAPATPTTAPTAGGAAATTGPGSWTLKAIGDVYTRLGAILALQGNFPGATPGTNISFYAGIAATRNLYSTNYSPFYLNADGTLSSVWNSSFLLGGSVPFRYRFDFESTTSTPILSLGVQMPFVSDPYFLQDFSNRSEDMDWGQVLGLGGAATITPPLISTFTWQVTSAVNIPTAGVTPYLSSLSISRLNAAVTWQSRKSTTWNGTGTLPDNLATAIASDGSAGSPSLYFFFPDLITIPDLGLNVGGTIFSIPSAAATATAKPATAADSGSLIAPWQTVKSDTTPEAKNGGGQFILPSLQQDIATATIPNVLNVTLGYGFTPGMTLQTQTDSAGWTDPSLVDYRLLYWTLQSQDSASLTYGASLYQNLVSLSGSLGVSGQYRTVFSRDSSVSDASWQAYIQSAALFSTLGVTNTVTLATQPFQSISALSQSSLSYNLGLRLFNRASQLDANGNPVYVNSGPSWDATGVTAQSVQLNLVASALDAAQQLQLTAVLPPLQQQLTGALTLRTGPLQSALSAGVTYPAGGLSGPPTYQLMTATETLSFGTLGQLQQLFQFDPQSNLFKQAVSSLTLGPVTASMSFNYLDSYTFAGIGNGWTDNLDPALRAQSLNLGIQGTWTPAPFWKNRITFSLGVNSQWQLNMVKFTDSTFTFGLNLTLHIADFLDFSFSSLSQNSVTYLYIPEYAAAIGRQWRNPLTDLLQSFNFFSNQDRQNSAFKLQQLAFTATHDLGDWTLSVTYSGSPQLGTTTPPQYTWTSQVSIVVDWKPIPELKGGVQLNQNVLQINQFTSTTSTGTTTP